ncbi:alpha-hydroxy-acid oxidizing protein [Oceanobacillus sp. APA_J-2(6-2)]|nr:alpha-hydroxy-acid oxidizing protein [Oceanobacillus alkalisoli]
MRENLKAFTGVEVVPRMLRDVEQRDLSINLFGQIYPSPILHAPIGVQSIIHKEGEVGSALAAAGQLGVKEVLQHMLADLDITMGLSGQSQ